MPRRADRVALPPSLSHREETRPGGLVLVLVALSTALTVPLGADGGITYRDLAAAEGSGLVYERVKSPRDAIFDEIKAEGLDFPQGLLRMPFKPRGAPGVALFDADKDGDLDLYVPNGPGVANSLFLNQMNDGGGLTFVDVGEASGAGAVDQDSNGVCFGDIDNDGDHDLMVVAPIEANRLFENRGPDPRGIPLFVDITETAGVGGGTRSSSSCAMGDIDGDGLLDLVVANTHTDWTHYESILIPFVTNEHNQLYHNTGGNVFTDVSATSGLQELAGFPPEAAGAASLTWAIAMLDLDLDGDVDIVQADDQGGVPFPAADGVNYGTIHFFQNDGTGVFTDVSLEAGLVQPGDWMGLSFGDFNCDGRLDIFGSNAGDYTPPIQPTPGQPPVGIFSSRWFLQRADGGFDDPGLNDALVASAFGWGTSAFDYDNDGDTDIVYHGDLDVGHFIGVINPGVYLQNQDCSARFLHDLEAVPGDRHFRRNVQGLASGDLNRDGLIDVVTVANFDIPEDVPVLPLPALRNGPLDPTARWVQTFRPTAEPGRLEWTGVELLNGSLAVEIADAAAGSSNGFLTVDLLGTIGLTSGGRVNRDGLGAVVLLHTADRDHPAMRPVLGGGSYASQDALAAHFGLGSADRGTIEVHWPGGARNRLRDVRSGERILFPEIPCDFDAQFDDRPAYVTCVRRALDELETAGVIDAPARRRLEASAFDCEAGAASLCLQGRRFRAEVTWSDFAGGEGTGQAVEISDESGYFTFFHAGVPEIHVNVLDGCALNGHVWVFAGASSNVGWALTLTDTVTGETRRYTNPVGETPLAITDHEAFATCPP